MSRELKCGGSIVGSTGYFWEVNLKTELNRWMPPGKVISYDEAVKTLGKRAEKTLGTVYEDYRKYASSLRYFPEKERDRAIRLISGLCDLAEYGGSRFGNRRYLLGLLKLEASAAGGFSRTSVSDLKKSAEIVARGKYTSASAQIELLEKATERDVLEVRDLNQARFLEAVCTGKHKDVLKDILMCAKYELEHQTYVGKCRYEIGSDRYIEWVEREVFGSDIKGLFANNYQYTGYLKQQLREVRNIMERDIEYGIRENDYITDPHADGLIAAVANLEKCGIDCYNLTEKIKSRAWFVGGDPMKIRTLQQRLNELGIGVRLKEDGVYGQKTHDQVNQFFDRIAEVDAPKLWWMGAVGDVLEEVTDSYAISGRAGNLKLKTEGILPQFVIHSYQNNPSGHSHGRYRKPRTNKKYKLYTTGHPKVKGAAANYQEVVIRQLDKTKIPPATYHFLKNMEGTHRILKVAGKTIVVAGKVLDVVMMTAEIAEDLNDEDQKLGRKSVKAVAGTVTSGVVGGLGGKYGALAGAAIGGLICPGIGNVIGAIVGGLVVGYFASTASETLVDYVVDVTMMEE